jgi:hypothetical protein
MNLLPRLRYLLELFHLPPLAVISVVEILIRIARHSTESAHQVYYFDCPFCKLCQASFLVFSDCRLSKAIRCDCW